MAARPRFGASIEADGVRFRVWSGAADRIWLCLFEGFDETRIEMERSGDGFFSVIVPGLKEGAKYGLRADGEYAPQRGLWFDPSKLLVDPYAAELDYPYRYNALMAAERWQQADIASIIPKALVTRTEWAQPAVPLFRPGGLIYEVNVRAFTRRHPDVPKDLRGTLAALAHPAIIDHLQKLGVSAVELMPVTAAIDERHLQPLGLRNAWGYNPVTFMALDPSLAPGGVKELRDTVAALRRAGIGTILDLVFNHTGESDAQGPTLSLRGLDARAYYRHDADARLVNDAGTGNTVNCEHPIVREMVLDSLRHFVLACGVDGFRFDLAPVLGRTERGFDAQAEMLRAIETDPVLANRALIAEPWDIGPGGYQLGRFGDSFLEWNDRYRDDVRRFWRGDEGGVGALATRLAGSSDIFSGTTRSVNFLAAHDGMTLADLISHREKRNEANGEDNRDGHDDNLSWNNGAEGPSEDPRILGRRGADLRALLATLFASRGTIMLTAGDEFGRSQRGNNNAYAQDNDITWLDWEGRDRDLEEFVALLSGMRRSVPALGATTLLKGETDSDGTLDVAWLSETGAPMTVAEWEEPQRRRLSMLLAGAGGRFAALVNGDRRATMFSLPARDGYVWAAVAGRPGDGDGHFLLAGRTVAFAKERRTA